MKINHAGQTLGNTLSEALNNLALTLDWSRYESALSQATVRDMRTALLSLGLSRVSGLRKAELERELHSCALEAAASF